jgi:hypothetical protein
LQHVCRSEQGHRGTHLCRGLESRHLALIAQLYAPDYVRQPLSIATTPGPASEQQQHRLTKLVPYPERGEVPTILARADELRAAIAPWRFDYDRTKAAVMKQTTIL